MTFYADLTDYRYTNSGIELVNIGWLGRDHEFKTGRHPRHEDLLERLSELGRRPATLMLGHHDCEFCPERVERYDESSGPVGTGEIHVFGANGMAFTTPTLIRHYIVRHGYCPPDDFVEAVLRPEAPTVGPLAARLCAVLESGKASLDSRTDAAIDLARWASPEIAAVLVNQCGDPEVREVLDLEIATSLKQMFAENNSLSPQILQPLPAGMVRFILG